jgi:hypothetical protein
MTLLTLLVTQHIASSDPLANPAIDPKFLRREYGRCRGSNEVNCANHFRRFTDLQALKHIVRFIQKITKTGPLASQISGGVVPPPDVDTDEQLARSVNSKFLSCQIPTQF